MNARIPLPLDDLKSRTAQVRLPLAQSRHAPGEFYASEDVARREKERIFLQTWLCAGREEEIASVGDYVTREIAGEPFVLSRDKDGSVRAFVNMCTHRGVAVVVGDGNARNFNCPYHAWVYRLDGKLISAPRMGEAKAALADAGMRPLKVRTWRGWVFVSFNPEPMPFDDFIAPYHEELWWFATEQCRLADKMVFEVDCNWKLLVENLVDVYHVPVLHKGTFGGFVKKNANDEFGVRLLPRGGWAYEQIARPHSATGERTFPMLPWLEGKSEEISSRAGIYPNISLSMRADSLRNWVVWPISASRCRLEVYLMFPHIAFEDPKFQANLDDYKRFITQLVSEDASMVVSLQHAMKSPLYEPGPMSPLEAAIQHLINNFVDVIAD